MLILSLEKYKPLGKKRPWRLISSLGDFHIPDCHYPLFTLRQILHNLSFVGLYNRYCVVLMPHRLIASYWAVVGIGILTVLHSN